MFNDKNSIFTWIVFSIGLLALMICGYGYAATQPKMDMRTSASINKIAILKPLRGVVEEVAKANGFTEERNAVYQQYRKSYEEAKRFVIELRAKDDSFILVENTDDARCVVITLYSATSSVEAANELKDKINTAIKRRFAHGVKVYPDSVCGGAGEFED